MVKWMLRLSVFVLVMGGMAAAEAPSVEERLARLEEALAELRQGAGGGAAPSQADLERRIEVLAQEIEALRTGAVESEELDSVLGMGPAASKVYSTASGVSVGGYGEMLYQNWAGTREDGRPSGERSKLDFLRAILYVGYRFTDQWLFNSEIEFEHAFVEGGEDSGEVAVEFAYLDYRHRDELGLRAGMMLIPMGLVNELHEPTVFTGALRPDTERRILPSTWRENGLGVYGDAGALSYRVYLVNGMDARGFSPAGLRGGRQSGGKAVADDLAVVGRLDWSPRPGLLLGTSLYWGDSGQGLEDASGRPLSVRTAIYDLHGDWRWRGLIVRGLVTGAFVGDAGALSRSLDRPADGAIAEVMVGGYLELGYDLLARRGGPASLWPYGRYEVVDTQASLPAGYEPDPAQRSRRLTLGVAYQPIQQVIVKADWTDVQNDADTGVDQISVSLGYIF